MEALASGNQLDAAWYSRRQFSGWRCVLEFLNRIIITYRLSDALQESLTGLNAYFENLSVKIVTILTKRCYDNLLPVRSIPTQLRMANKRTPTEPSSFVPSILRPLKQFFDGQGSSLKDGYLQQYSTEVFNHVTQR